MRCPYTDDELLTVAQTVYGEARGEPVEGKEAVAQVIVNRALMRRQSLTTVCRTPKQFSCWNNDDPNRKLIESMSLDSVGSVWQECVTAARHVLLGAPDLTRKSQHYCVSKLFPDWSVGKTPVYEVGNHKFFNDVR